MRPDLTTAVYRVGSAVVQRIPPAVVAPARKASSKLAAHASRERRFMIGRHLRRVVGDELQGRALERMIDLTIDAYARYWVDSARLQGISDAKVDEGFTVEGFEHIEDAFARGVGPILALPHLGGWEWAGRWLTCRPAYEVTVVVEQVTPPALFEWMVEYRESFGMHVVTLGPNVASTVIRALKEQHVVCLLCDRDIVGDGVEVQFFGETTTLPAGPVTIALRTGAAIIPVGVYQRPGRHHGVVRPALDLSRSGRLREDVARLTQTLATELEALIAASPEQWHLMGPNWPSDHKALSGFRDSRS